MRIAVSRNQMGGDWPFKAIKDTARICCDFPTKIMQHVCASEAKVPYKNENKAEP